MVEAQDSTRATARTTLPWAVLLVLVVIVGLGVRDEPLRHRCLQSVLILTAMAEAMAGFMYVFKARRMAERAGRPYAPAYHGAMQDFGFYNLTMALLLTLCAADLAKNAVVLWAAVALYAVHGGTHVLRYFGFYYGGETRIPTRPRDLELRDGLQLVVALAAMIVFYPSAIR